MWSWAKNFVLFDNFRQTIVGPSTPNAIAIIAGQSGQTQWALHPDEGAASPTPIRNSPTRSARASAPRSRQTISNAYVPIVADPGPFPGSNLDTNAVKPPYNFDENAANPALNLTFATQPLSFMGSNIEKIIKSDPNPTADLRDVQDDIKEVAEFRPPGELGLVSAGVQRPTTRPTPTSRRARDAEPDQRPRPLQRLRPASQRPAVFRLSRRQPHGAEHQPARRQGLLRRGRGPQAAGRRRRVLSARRLQQQRRPRSRRSDAGDPATRSSATTTIPPIRISRSRRPSRPGDQRHRQQPLLVAERHHHHL